MCFLIGSISFIGVAKTFSSVSLVDAEVFVFYSNYVWSFLKFSIELIGLEGCISPIARCCSASEVFLETLHYRAE